MRGFDWRGLIALVIAAGVVAILIIAEFSAAHNPNRAGTITAEEATTISTVLGALIGALAVYLGGAVRESREPRPPPGILSPPGDDSRED